MSEQIPESIPTSADPRSHRPLKKSRPTPRSETASSISALFSKPDQEIRLPSTSTSLSNSHGAPPEIVANVQGSSAGAGSGEFHVYKASRRREYERMRAMDEEVQKEKDEEEWEKEKREREEKDRERTRKNREKREKLKKKKGGKGAADGAADGGDAEAAKVEKFKPRAMNVPEGDGKDIGEQETGEGEQPVGVIIHDDDD